MSASRKLSEPGARDTSQQAVGESSLGRGDEQPQQASEGPTAQTGSAIDPFDIDSTRDEDRDLDAIVTKGL
jgi:hypothetical protein